MATTDAPDGLTLRSLSLADIDAGCALSAEAGWNQNEADWHAVLSNGLAWGYEDRSGHLGASAALLPYGDTVAWVCMVLVSQSWQKQGLATALLRHCIQEAESRGWVPGLDATSAGRNVYLPLGFKDVFPLSRFMAQSPAMPARPANSPCRPMSGSDVDAVRALDAAASGVDRGALIQHLAVRAPHLAWIAEDNGTLSGFCLGRDGRDADQIGPLTAQDPDTAATLLSHALLSREDGTRRLYIDAVESQTAFTDLLTGHGFTKQRGFSRMVKGSAAVLGDSALMYAIAGPELS